MLRLQKKKERKKNLPQHRFITVGSAQRGGVWSWSRLSAGRKASSAILCRRFPTSRVSRACPAFHSTRSLAGKRECLSRGAAQRLPSEKLESASTRGSHADSHPSPGASGQHEQRCTAASQDAGIA